MTQDEIIKMAHEAGLHIATDVNWMPIIGLEYAEKFAKLVAEHERKEMQAKIETLYAMYELAVKQRDYLMDQERAQVAAMRGRIQ
jgi:hypothetical protein